MEKARIARILAKLNIKTEYVSGYPNKYGTSVDPYLRRPRGTLAKIEFFERYGKWVDGAGWVLTAFGFALDAKSTYDSAYQARPDLGRGHAIAMGIAHASYATGGALVGAFFGSLLLPGVGTVVGGFVGGWVGNWLGDQFVEANDTPNNGYTGPANQDVPGPASGL